MSTDKRVNCYEVRWTVTFSQVIDDDLVGDVSSLTAREAADCAVEDGAGTIYTKNMNTASGFLHKLTEVQAYDRDGNPIGRPKYIPFDRL